jgi:hypothetical protein
VYKKILTLHTALNTNEIADKYRFNNQTFICNILKVSSCYSCYFCSPEKKEYERRKEPEFY